MIDLESLEYKHGLKRACAALEEEAKPLTANELARRSPAFRDGYMEEVNDSANAHVDKDDVISTARHANALRAKIAARPIAFRVPHNRFDAAELRFCTYVLHRGYNGMFRVEPIDEKGVRYMSYASPTTHLGCDVGCEACIEGDREHDPGDEDRGGTENARAT